MKVLRSTRARRAFTLVELVVVVLILGILAVIAAPKMINVSSEAGDNSLKQTLSVIRGAIEIYQTQNGGALPGQSNNLPADLSPYLRGSRFPANSVVKQDNAVTYTTGSPITADSAPLTAWKYSTDTGEFICNSNLPTATDRTVTYDQL